MTEKILLSITKNGNITEKQKRESHHEEGLVVGDHAQHHCDDGHAVFRPSQALHLKLFV